MFTRSIQLDVVPAKKLISWYTDYSIASIGCGINIDKDTGISISSRMTVIRESMRGKIITQRSLKKELTYLINRLITPRDFSGFSVGELILSLSGVQDDPPQMELVFGYHDQIEEHDPPGLISRAILFFDKYMSFIENQSKEFAL